MDWDYERSRCWQPQTIEDFAEAHNDLHRVPRHEKQMTKKPDPVVAEVRRAPVDLTAMRRKLDAYGVFSLADAELLIAEVARLTAERDELLSVKRSLSDQLICSRGHEAATHADLEILRGRLRGLESEATLMQQMSGEFVKAIPVTELAALLATPEEPSK